MNLKSTLLAITALTLSTNVNGATVSFTLDSVFLNGTSQMTGTFDWTYSDGDFENGTGQFSELFIPLTSHVLADLNVVFDITKSIEFTLIDNLDSDGVDISLVFDSALTPTQSTLLSLSESKWSLGGAGTNNPFISGDISPVVLPFPAAAGPFGSGFLGLLGFAGQRRAKK